MKLLLDTHTLLWAIAAAHKLSPQAQQHFLDSDNQLFFSMASLWEICIKVSLGKLTLAPDGMRQLHQALAANQIQWLPIASHHCEALLHLPWHHRDPFDRLLVAQAQQEQLAIISADSQLSAYPIHRIW